MTEYLMHTFSCWHICSGRQANKTSQYQSPRPRPRHKAIKSVSASNQISLSIKSASMATPTIQLWRDVIGPNRLISMRSLYVQPRVNLEVWAWGPVTQQWSV